MHLDGAHHAAIHAVLLKAVLQGQRVDDRGEHAHVVALRAVHALRGALDATIDVTAAHDHGNLDAVVIGGLDCLRDALRNRRIDAEVTLAHQGLARELQQDTVVFVISQDASSRP